jgi:signal transduction histidine kinase
MVLILQGPNYIIELANPVALQVLGRKGDEVLNKPLFEAIPELQEQGLDLLLDGVYATGVPYIGKELKVKVDREGNGNPEDLYFNIVYAPRYNHANIIEGVMCYANEVSEHIAARNKVEEYSENIKENNVELLAKNKQLTKINNDLDNFIYTASHDLKAPISNIEGLMHVLIQNLPEEVREKPTIKKVASMIEQSVNRFKSTILDLTEISKLQKQVGENTSIINLHELIEEVKFDMESEIEKTKAQIFTDLQNCNEVDFSEKNLRSIVYNLISNAIKYHSTERKPQIDISCRKEEGFYVIKVRDNGLGIDPAQHDKIFSMFKRVHTHVDGSGVGLYIVKRIIENSGDRIELESEVGKGSTFTVYLKASK